MWELYNRGEGTVAIKSTVGRLKEVLRSRPETSCVGSVKYVNRSTHAEKGVRRTSFFARIFDSVSKTRFGRLFWILACGATTEG